MGMSLKEIQQLDDGHPVKEQALEQLADEGVKKARRSKEEVWAYKAIKKMKTIEEMSLQKIFHVTPMGKPRMTRSDKWKERPVVQRYWEFKNEITRQRGKFKLPDWNYWVVAFMPFPKSYTNKKRRKLIGTFHQLTPDKDNIEKALLDALRQEDKEIGDGRVTKIWEREGGGRIEIYY